MNKYSYNYYDIITRKVKTVLRTDRPVDPTDNCPEGCAWVEGYAEPGWFITVDGEPRPPTLSEILLDKGKLRDHFTRLEETPATVTYNGNDYQFSLATTDLYRMRLIADNWSAVAPLLAGNKLPWVLADNSVIELNQGQFTQVVGVLERRKAKRLARIMLKYHEVTSQGTPTLQHVHNLETALDTGLGEPV